MYVFGLFKLAWLGLIGLAWFNWLGKMAWFFALGVFWLGLSQPKLMYLRFMGNVFMGTVGTGNIVMGIDIVPSFSPTSGHLS